ncbi:MAG: lipopolysaccharide transport periplasmic protein LptA [Desulfuromusa sp.]|nr:lipopolysaccharide transport periplasmic protein LptA [Desulfuromusa sp.]
MMGRWLLLLFGVLCCCVPVTFADEVTPGFDRNQPIEITAQKLEVLQLERQSIFTGEVVAIQGEMTLSADKLIVYLQEAEDQIDQLEAIGRVRFVQLDRVATADQAIFQQEKEVLILTGNAVVTQGENTISGDEITLFIQENRTLIKGSENNRVKAVIVPEKKKEKP